MTRVRFTYRCLADRRLPLLAALAIGAAVCRPAVATDYDVYLLAGQSNMDGRGPVADLVGPLLPFAGMQQDVRIRYSNGALRQPLVRSDGWQPLRPGFGVPPGDAGRQTTTSAASITAAATSMPTTMATSRPVGHAPVVPGPVFGPEIGFAKTMVDAGLSAGHRLAIIKYAASGANLRVEWNPATPDLLYSRFIPFVRQSLAELKTDRDTLTVRGLLWHQGESDAKLSSAEYARLLTQLITAVRRDLNAPDLPVFLGEPADNGRRLSIRAAQLAVARSTGKVYVVGSGDLQTLDGGTHFTAGSQIELGRRFAVAVLTRADVMPSTMPATMPASRPTAQDPP